LTSFLCTARAERVAELLEEVAQIAKAVDADEIRPLALDRRGRLARLDHYRVSVCSGTDELRPSIVDILNALDVAERRVELVHEVHDRLLVSGALFGNLGDGFSVREDSMVYEWGSLAASTRSR
jgi:hypothetical protein